MKNRSTKRGLVGIGVVIAMLAGGSAALAIHQFPDVPDSHPFHDDIDFMAERRITGGFGDGTYRPDANVTRGQMSRFMTRLADALTPTIFSAGDSFTFDVAAGSGTGCLTAPWIVPDYDTQISMVSSVSMLADGSEPSTVSMVPTVFASLDGGATASAGTGWAGFSVAPGEENASGAEVSFNTFDVFAPGDEVVFGASLVPLGVSPTNDSTAYCSLLVTVDHQMPGNNPLPPSGGADAMNGRPS